jgi:hypothetical protein
MYDYLSLSHYTLSNEKIESIVNESCVKTMSKLGLEEEQYAKNFMMKTQVKRKRSSEELVSQEVVEVKGDDTTSKRVRKPKKIDSDSDDEKNTAEPITQPAEDNVFKTTSGRVVDIVDLSSNAEF